MQSGTIFCPLIFCPIEYLTRKLSDKKEQPKSLLFHDLQADDANQNHGQKHDSPKA